MKVAFISLYNTAPWGGCEDLWVETAKFAASNGHDVLASVFDFGESMSPKILALEKYGITLDRRKRITHENSISKRIYNYAIKQFISERDTYSTLVKFNPDTILINDPGTFIYVRNYSVLHKVIEENNFSYSIVCKLTPDYSSSIPDDLARKSREVFSRAKQMLFVSHKMKDNVERYLAIHLTNSKVIQNPVNLKSYETVNFPNTKMINFAAVAHLGVAHKGQHILLNILGSETWKSRSWNLNLYGSGPDKVYLQDLAKFYNISDKVSFAGYVDSIEEVWKKNHILLHPSTSEGMPKALVEAMVCGRTLVVSEVGGNSEIVQNNVTGFIADAPSVRSFGKAMERAWNKKDEWENLGKEAHKSIMEWVDTTPEDTLLKLLIQSEK